jgi:hypothetical protein
MSDSLHIPNITIPFFCNSSFSPNDMKATGPNGVIPNVVQPIKDKNGSDHLRISYNFVHLFSLIRKYKI